MLSSASSLQPSLIAWLRQIVNLHLVLMANLENLGQGLHLWKRMIFFLTFEKYPLFRSDDHSRPLGIRIEKSSAPSPTSWFLWSMFIIVTYWLLYPLFSCSAKNCGKIIQWPSGKMPATTSSFSKKSCHHNHFLLVKLVREKHHIFLVHLCLPRAK